MGLLFPTLAIIIHNFVFSTINEQVFNRKTNADLSDMNRDCKVQNNADRSFSTSYSKLRKALNKRGPIITLSRRREKQISWARINLLINRTKKNSKPILSILSADSNQYTYDPTKISDVLNIHFSSVVRKLASKIPLTNCRLTELYLSGNYSESFFFNPVTAFEVENGIVSILLNKAQGLYSCPTRILRSAKHILSKPLAEIMNMSVTMGQYPKKLKHA